jgi:hypothetical protein
MGSRRKEDLIMFDQLFRYPAVLRRHRDGPLADERTAYLARLAARGSAPGTLLKYARYCLAIAHVVQATPHDRSFTTSDIDILCYGAFKKNALQVAGPWPIVHGAAPG